MIPNHHIKPILGLALSVCAFSPAVAHDLRLEIPVNHCWWWNAPETPEIIVTATDTVGANAASTVSISVTTDRAPHHAVARMAQTVRPGVNGEKLTFSLPGLEPGFYRVTVYDDGREAQSFNIGFEPENVVSLPDAQPDLRQFWDRALSELAAVAPEYKVTERKDRSGKSRKMYHVQMLSWGGDTIQGYLAVPVAKGKHPAQIYYNGYNADPWEFDPEARPDWIEFLLFGRGQGLNKPTNKYGDWIQYNLDDPDNYYYKGAFMDCVRAIDFVEQLPQTDTSRIYAEGGSQGGAFTLAAAALDPKGRLRAIAPYIPFLSDYGDYFAIVPWPANAVLPKAREIGLSDEQLYRNLSYFDIKNLARWITCPVLMGAGLQDPVCPPHTNFSSFNLIDTDKEFVIYPTLGHTVEYSDWNPRRDDFFSRH